MSSRQTSKSNRPIGILRRLAAAALTAALLAQPAAAEASTPPEAEPPVDLAVSSYAADYSVSITEAQRRLDRIQPLQEILASIRDLEAARLAGWGIDHTASFGGWVWLTGNAAPSAAAAAIADAHADVRIRTSADHSLAELLTAQQGLFRTGAVGRVNDGPASGVAAMVTFTGINMAANAVRIGIDPALAAVVPGGLTDTGPATVTDEAFRAKAAEVTEQLRSQISVNYIIEDGRDLSNNASFIGGQQIGACTSGFTARQRGTGIYGIISAGHCKRQPFDMHDVTLTLVKRRHGPYIDAQFLSIPTGSSHRLFDEFVCGRVLPCDVAGDVPRFRMMGSYICHYGRNSGNSCGTVIDINHRPTHNRSCEEECNNTFVRVTGPNLRACYGDSGGPWYHGSTAYGIQGGGSESSDCVSGNKFAYFSAIRDVENRLGVNILIRGPITVP